MATSLRFTTPPPPSSSMRVPKTPRLGYEDDYQPYSPRKSTRVSHRQRDAHTPPPHPSGHNLRGSQTTPQSLPRSSRRSASSTSPSSPQTATKKLPRTSLIDSAGRRVSGALNQSSTALAATALGLPSPKRAKPEPQSTATTRTAGMLPTPAKTPKKRPNGTTPAIKSVARSLFSSVRTAADDEVMPSPRKNRSQKKYHGFNLDSFEGEEEAAPIPIYTDSAERIPEVDRSEENPFLVDTIAAQPEPSKLRSHKRKKISVEGEEDQYIEDLERREDGMIVVFRGKKRFRKFSEIEREGSDEEGEPGSGDDADLEMPRRLHRPLTRSQIKPRRLFETKKPVLPAAQATFDTEDEEADTDIEEKHVEFDFAATPKAPKFAPSMASPPTTARVTRSTKLDVNDLLSDDEAEPVTPSRGRTRHERISPFEGWGHGKSIPASKKRTGSPIGHQGVSKRLRS